MPFQSEKQRKYLWANEPEIAREWTDKYGSRVKKQDGGNTWFGGDPRAFFNKHAPYTMNLVGKTPVEKWINQPELIDLETRYGLGSAGLPSIARHTAGMSNLSDTFARALAFNKNNPGGISQFFGDVGAFSAGALNEIPGTWRGLTGSAKDRAETWEDIKANALGTFKTPYGKTSEDIYKDVYAGKYADLFNNQKGTIVPDKGIMKTNVLSNIWDAIKNEFGGSAQAADLSGMIPKNLEKTIEEGMRSYRESNEISPALRKAIEEGTSYNEWDRIPNEKYHGIPMKRISLNQDEEETFIDPHRIPGRIQKSVPRKMGILEKFRNRFYKPATSAAGGYNVSQLNKMNALGGYYSEPARQQRRTDARRTNILNRAAKGKAVGNVNALLGKHGYQSTPGGGLQFTGQHEGSSTAGAGYSRSDSGWSSSPFRRGGLASLWQR